MLGVATRDSRPAFMPRCDNNLRMNYFWDNQLNLFRSSVSSEFAYSDGVEAEARLLDIVSGANDRSTFSGELVGGITDWPTEYHLSRSRHCLVRPLGIQAGNKVLELGCGCGAITRFLGETGADVVAVEGSLSRARVAAERCRELGNVRVFAGDLLRFETDERFDFVLLIGVLEYAPLFSDQEDPIGHYLRSVSRFLAPGGKLVVAIENKLGLKYFNGCGEDHVGIPFFGIQNLYGPKTVRTFGHKELVAQLSAAGLSHTYFFYPFPDYKLPTVVLSEDGLNDDGFDAVDLLSRCHGRDYAGLAYRSFDDALAFSALSENGLLADLSNSFLVVATAEAPMPQNNIELASAYSIYRTPEFCTRTKFLRCGNRIVVSKEPLTSVPAHPVSLPSGITISHHIEESDYQLGRQLFWGLLTARARSGDLRTIVQALRPWMEFLLQHARVPTAEVPGVLGKISKLASYQLPGKYIDCTPFNLLDIGTELVPIDLEWRSDRDVSLGWVVTRGILWSINSGLLPAGRPHTIAEVIETLVESCGLAVTESEIQVWLDQESAFQTLVLDRPSEVLVASRTVTGIRTFADEIVSLEQRRTTMSQALAAREDRIVGLNHVVFAQQGQVSSLGATVAARDSQIADLDQLAAARDTQIAGLERALGTSRDRIGKIEQKLREANERLTSFSYKFTEPVRSLGKLFPRAASFGVSAAKVGYWMATGQILNRLRQRKLARALLGSGLFDGDFYLRQYSDVADSGANPLVHYLSKGVAEGRKPNPYFDTAFYLRNNLDVAISGINPLLHYLADGFKEGREPSAEFSGIKYLEANPDVRASGENPLSHFMKRGRAEGRPIAKREDEMQTAVPRTLPTVPPDPYQRAARMLQACDGKRRMFVMDYAVPTPDMDSGSVRMFSLLRLLTELGFPVTFAAHEPRNGIAYVNALKAMGLEVLQGYEQVRSHLEERGNSYSTVILSRPELAATYLAVARAYAASAEVVYDSVDLHYLRLRRGAELARDPELVVRAEQYFRIEKLSFAFADRVLAVSETEKQAILQAFPMTKVEVVPNVHSVNVSPEPWSARQGLVFIGGFQHEPNIDAMVWFVRDVFPRIEARIPGVQFTILGSKPTETVKSLASRNVNVVGWVPDPTSYFAASRVFVAPLRYGAGMKGKIGQAMSLGLPVVTTQIGAEGMHLTDGVNAKIADGPDAFSAAVVDLYTDEVAWTRIRMEAAAHIESNFSETAVRNILKGLFSSRAAVNASPSTVLV